MARNEIEARLVEGRECGSCTLCCRVLGIGEILKPPGQTCPDCAVGEGCTIYDRRPLTCRDFYCGFLLMKDLGEEWRPSQSRLILLFDGEDNRVRVHVDRVLPSAKRRQDQVVHFVEGLLLRHFVSLVSSAVGDRSAQLAGDHEPFRRPLAGCRFPALGTVTTAF